MKRGTLIGLIIAGVLVLGVGGAVAVTALGGGESEAVATQTPTPEPEATMEPSEEPEAEAEAETEEDTAAAESETTPGAYVEYSEAALADAEGTRVLFFHATWCPQCHALDDSINANGVPDGVTILKVDYDTNQDLRQEYGVTQQTTVVSLDDNGDKAVLYVPYSNPTLGDALNGLGLS